MGMYPLSLLESRVAAQGMELCIDSRKATPGCVFVALPGSSADGSQFIADAVARSPFSSCMTHTMPGSDEPSNELPAIPML